MKKRYFVLVKVQWKAVDCLDDIAGLARFEPFVESRAAAIKDARARLRGAGVRFIKLVTAHQQRRVTDV